MRRFFLTVAMAGGFSVALAQTGTPSAGTIEGEGRAPYRTEFISYDVRSEVDADRMEGSKYFRALDFRISNTTKLYSLYEAVLEIPGLWLDREVYIRDTGRTGRYRLVVNGEEVGLNTDSYGTNEYYVSPYLRQGENKILLVFTGDDIPGGDMERFTDDPSRATINSLYLFSQPRIHIFDYTVSGHYDEQYRDAVLDLALVVVNGYNMPQTVTVGYDIYDPQGRLKEYTFRDVVIPGRGCDTVHFYNKVMGTERFRYSAENPALYKVVLSVKRDGRNIEYIPFRMGFGITRFEGGTIVRADGMQGGALKGASKVAVSAIEGDFTDRREAAQVLRAAKKRGVNTLRARRPQQKWLYDMCEELGLWVIDRAAVECDPKGGDRGPDGTVANKPEYVERFLDRQRAMFYRNRNRPNVIGWETGSVSGNGYNMYKAYELLKSLDGTRPVVYSGAEGEWNTDTLR